MTVHNRVAGCSMHWYMWYNQNHTMASKYDLLWWCTYNHTTFSNRVPWCGVVVCTNCTIQCIGGLWCPGVVYQCSSMFQWCALVSRFGWPFIRGGHYTYRGDTRRCVTLCFLEQLKLIVIISNINNVNLSLTAPFLLSFHSK